MISIRHTLFAAALILAPSLALAQSTTMPMQPGTMQPGTMPGMDHGAMPGMSGGTMDHGAMHGAPAATPADPSSAAFAAANERMHKGMAIPFTGDTDVDFARGMIPHHQGAIDMATIELQYGTDPELRKLAEAIIKAQESEIAFLKEWLAKKGK
ncbi:CopM family metallochaperone [Ancylobacter terrae]|uniref:CopM family metallochaperone n=1 Tax=Ancylobacter sp. sgz301288 TaxID=3342077 RepID=UPI003858186F